MVFKDNDWGILTPRISLDGVVMDREMPNKLINGGYKWTYLFAVISLPLEPSISCSIPWGG
jgi:hypothetical protein